MRNDPRDITRIVRLSRASYTKMVQNLAWAVGYNAIALPLAAGVAAPLGLVLPAWVGAVLMSLSTIIVALNAQLRYAHSQAYLEGLAQGHGLRVLRCAAEPIRRDRTQTIPGLYLYLGA